MMLGILGVGHLAASILAGLARSGVDPAQVLLSPRGRAAEMAARYGFGMAADNGDLVRRSELVLLAVRPASVSAAVSGLPWRDGQVVMSACAGISLAQIDVGPARPVRVMPVTASEIGASPTVCFPDVPEARAVLDRLGPVISVNSEAEFEIATVSAAVYGWAQEIIRLTANWSAAQGLDAATARRLAARTFVAAGALIDEKAAPMEQMLGELVTPGGITERGLHVLADAGLAQGWEAACTAVLESLRAH